MLAEKTLRDHAKLIAKDLKTGQASASIGQARGLMEQNPETLLDLIDLVEQAASRKKPNQALVNAYVLMFAMGLEGLRYEMERDQEWAEALLDAIRDDLALLAGDGDIDPGTLMLLLNGFIEARLEPGEELTQLLGDLSLDQAERDMPADMLPDIDTLFDELAKEAGGNLFEAHAAFGQASQALPSEFRQAIIVPLATCKNPVLRDMAALYLLDPSAEVRRSFCQAMSESASPETMSPATLRRMIALRNWLPEKERHHLDAAIKKARQKQVDCAPWPTMDVLSIEASKIDGVGAQSVFAVVKDGRKHMIACLLVKSEVGIADVWCLYDQSKAEVREFSARIEAETGKISVDADYLRQLIVHHLAVGLEDGKAPPAGLLEFVEVMGLDGCQPAASSVDDLIALMSADIEPERLEAKAVDDLVQGSGDWPDQHDFLDSWFENDALVEEVLERNPKLRMPGRVKAVTKSVLEPRRGKWAERFLRTALWLKQQEGSRSPWRAFFVMGRELHRGRPMARIPIMQHIAEVTVEMNGGSMFLRNLLFH